MLNGIKSKINIALRTGLFHILSTNVLKNALSFISGIILVRLIPKNEYGIYSYAFNLISYFLLLSGLGVVSAVFQLCCENQDNKEYSNRLFNYGVKSGYIINFILTIIILIYGLLYSGDMKGVGSCLICMSLYPFTSIAFDFSTIFFRYRLENVKYANCLNVYSIISFVSSIICAWQWGIYGLIFANYISQIGSIIVSKLNYGYKYTINDCQICHQEKKLIWRMAITSMFTNAVSNIMYLIDVSVIGEFLKNEADVASYKIATKIPTAFVLIASSIVTYVYPFFARKIDDINWTKKMAKKLLGSVCIFYAMVSVFLFIFSKHIVLLLFGMQYYDSIATFKVLSIALFFQCALRSVFGNLLVTQRKLRFNLFESIVSGIINIIGDYYLIRKYGIIGVAYATLIVMVFSGVMCMSYYFYTLNRRNEYKMK